MHLRDLHPLQLLGLCACPVGRIVDWMGNFCGHCDVMFCDSYPSQLSAPHATELIEHCRTFIAIIRVFIRKIDFFFPAIRQPFADDLLNRMVFFRLGVSDDSWYEMDCRNGISFVVEPSSRNVTAIVFIVVNYIDISGNDGVRLVWSLKSLSRVWLHGLLSLTCLSSRRDMVDRR